MMDLSRFFDDLWAGLEGSVPGSEPDVPGSLAATGNGQIIDKYDSSRCSRSSRSGNIQTVSDDAHGPEFQDFSAQRVARTSSYVKTPGTPGTPGTGAKNPAGSTSLQFPVKEREPGTPGTGSGFSESTSDPNHAGPQSDWWNADHLAALAPQLAPPTPPGDPLPISPTDVRAGVDRELQALAARGRTGPDALRDAVEITRAKIRNAPALMERQANSGRCHICDEPLDDSLPVIAVLTGKPGSPLFLHAGCHDEHSRRVAGLVDRIMAAAGFGVDEKEASGR